MPEQSFARLLAILRGRWLLITAVAVPILLLSGWFAASLTPAYTSEAVLSLSPEPAAAADNTFLRLVPRYLSTATSAEARRAAEERAGLPEGALADSVTAENPSDTIEIALTATTASAGAAGQAVDTLADAVIREAASDPLVRAELLSGPSEPVDGTPTRRILVGVVGLALALVPGVCLAFLAEGARPRIRVRDDVAALGIPVLPRVGRTALRRRWPFRGGRAGSRALAVLHGELAAFMNSQRDTALVVMAATAKGEAAAAALTGVLPPGLRTERPVHDEFVAGRHTLLVLPAGTRLDDALDRVRLLQRLDARIVGGVVVG